MESKEALVYDLLKESLSQSYIVVHSLPVQRVDKGRVEIVEIDFVIFNPDMGVLTLEVKAGSNFEYYSDSSKGGDDICRVVEGRLKDPVRAQAHRAYQCFMNKYSDRCKEVGKRLDEEYPFGFCKSNYAVWFLDLTRHELDRIGLPTGMDPSCVLTLEDREDPEGAIERIMRLERKDGSYHKMTPEQADRFVREFLAPSGRFPSSPERENAELGAKLFELTDGQTRVLEYLRYERMAAVTGVGGTGKSVIARTRALQLAQKGRKVLYLCYNKLFGDSLRSRFDEEPNIRAMTIDGYAAFLIDPKGEGYFSLEEWEYVSEKNRYEKLAEIMDHASELRDDGAFEGLPKWKFTDLIIDEAQDFGAEGMDDLWLSILGLYEKGAVLEEGSLYVFYDELQVEPGAKLPVLLTDVKCRLALYVNCRNSREIATLGLRAFGKDAERGISSKSLDTASGHEPAIIFVDRDKRSGRVRPGAYVSKINSEIKRYKGLGIPESEITIITCATLGGQNETCLRGLLEERSGLKYWKGSEIRFETVRKFKGLESDAVIVVEAGEDAWAAPKDGSDSKEGVLLYLGTSRARKELTVVFEMDDASCDRVLKQVDAKVGRREGRDALKWYFTQRR